MPIPLAIPTCACLTMMLLLCGCSQRESLDYETAINLLRDRNIEPVKLTFSSAPSRNSDIRVRQAYDRLEEAHVLACKSNETLGKVCEAGPAGDILTQTGATELTVFAGRWMPAAVVSIDRDADDSAVADVRMTFEPAPLYREFGEWFDEIEDSHGALLGVQRKQGRMVHATFRHMEDGWHLAGVD